MRTGGSRAPRKGLAVCHTMSFGVCNPPLISECGATDKDRKVGVLKW